MTLEAALLLGLVGAALITFATERLPVDVTALALLGVLVVLGIVPAERALDGFGNSAVIAIGALFVLGHALSETGLLARFADILARRSSRRPRLGYSLIVGAAAVLSGFLNNTAVVTVFIPIAMDYARRVRISPSKVLMPLSYAVICGGMLTLVGTSTTLLVSSLLASAGLPRIDMFEITALGVVFLVVGLIYSLTVAVQSGR